jgi:hypothetical protein
VERDLLAGRSGSASVRRSRVLLPMSFRDFLATTRPGIPLLDVIPPRNLQGKQVADSAEMLAPFADELRVFSA